MNIRRPIFYGLVLLSFFISAQLTSAHSYGQSIEKTEDGYVMDVAYDSLNSSPTAGEPVRFDARLYHEVNRETADFSSIVFMITQNETPFVAATVLKSDLGTGATVTFPKSGDYQVQILFQDSAVKELIKTSFPIKVLPADYELVAGEKSRNYKMLVSGLLLGIVFGGIGMIGIRSRKK